MIIKITNNKAQEIYLNGNFFKIGVPIEVSFSDAQRLSRLSSIEMIGEPDVYNPELFDKEKKFTFISNIDEVSGWGNVSVNLIKFSSPEYLISQSGVLNNVKDQSVCKASHRDIEPSSAAIIHEQPKEEWLSLPFQKKIVIVPFETTIIPNSWIHRINSCSALFVPCQQNIEAFRNSGVTVPIELIHWGIDPTIFYELERPKSEIFTFGIMGALSRRKGTDILLEAFQKAFPTETDVQLICKSSYNSFIGALKDKRIKIELTPIPYEELRDNFFKRLDCFVFPTRGEGFGLTPLEAMATGIPAIVTGWSGPLEYMTPEVGWLIDHKMVPAEDFTKNVYKEECGDWAEPSIDHLVFLMRYAYEHRDEVRQKGKNAAEHVRQNWLWKDKIHMFHAALKKHL